MAEDGQSLDMGKFAEAYLGEGQSIDALKAHFKSIGSEEREAVLTAMGKNIQAAFLNGLGLKEDEFLDLKPEAPETKEDVIKKIVLELKKVIDEINDVEMPVFFQNTKVDNNPIISSLFLENAVDQCEPYIRHINNILFGLYADLYPSFKESY